MKKILLVILLICAPVMAFAQEYQANTWASWASVSNTTQTTWMLPYRSRTVSIMNGSNQVIGIAFGNQTILTQGCTTAPLGNGNNKVFQLPATQWITLNDMVTNQINLLACGSSATASPVSVLVNY